MPGDRPMTDTPWTPGPWEAMAWQGEDRAKGRLHRVAAAHGVSICKAVHTDADARLIAAAPEMADILADLVAMYDSPLYYEGHPVGQSRALLSRIRGEA